ncbi:serine/threonine-protein kinase [Acaryochloris sp. CCMEE 5410]|uniref:serine/threonine-protein kinase n=1 Tax=Acaryochloris sp. CCMEE 5410 TaxID=310037 RepID=UPI0002483BE0|nr:serine/threonine-protein kinase [Acaryochloris sp. CCMEE 5410]KAI9134593.1 serine/threonine protein kinase [Acaryochloris sp. CCMEE 5410]
MTLCIAPQCSKPDNSDNSVFCQTCGSELLLEGRYRVTKLIGQGGFGKTYEVREVVRATGTSNSGIPKVLKVLTDQQPKAVELFTREAQVLSQLRHPGIPQVDTDGHFIFWPRDSQTALHCLIMEKIEGLDLCGYMKQRQFRPISEQLALEWLTQIMTILNEVHSQQFFHRDIKPSNIMLRPDGQLVLIDFGAVRAVTQTYMAKQGAQGVTGIHSMGFTPPEQMNGQAVMQSDFYALGRTWVYLLTGKEPTDSSIYDPYSDQCQWRESATHISPPFANLVDDLMARLPKDRPANTQIILQRLRTLDREFEQSRQQTEVSQGSNPPPFPQPSATPSSPAQPPPVPPSTVPPTDIQAPPEPLPVYTPPPSAPFSTSQPPAGVPPTDIQAPGYSTPSHPPNQPSQPQQSPPPLQSSAHELEEANRQIKTAWIAGIVLAVLTFLIGILSGSDTSFWLIDVVISAGLTFGIYKKVRACAVLMLIYYILGRLLWVSAALESGEGVNPAAIGLGGAFIYFYVQGVKGTYTHHRLTTTQQI